MTAPPRTLTGPALGLARAAWAAGVTATLVLFFLCVPLAFDLAQQPCVGHPCFTDQLTPAGVRNLEALGLTPRFYAAYSTVLAVASVVLTAGMGLLIAWRRSREPVALLVSGTLVLLGVFINTHIEALAALGLAWELTVDVGESLMWLCFPLLFYVFPDGRFVPRWTWLAWLVWFYTQAAYYVGLLYVPARPFNPGDWPPEPQVALYAGLLLSCLIAQVYRFRRVSSPLQRQQTKWVVFGFVAAIGVLLAFGIVPSLIYPELMEPGRLSDFILDFVAFLALAFLPITFGISILRYRLWDIDVLIRRTLTYALVTGGLALAYACVVLVLQTAFAALLGRPASTLVSVLSTLAIAALFSPLRRRVQRFIDRRFYRRKYDAAQALAALAASARDDLDLAGLTDRLVHVVEDTMQPAHISLWLKRSPDGGA